MLNCFTAENAPSESRSDKGLSGSPKLRTRASKFGSMKCSNTYRHSSNPLTVRFPNKMGYEYISPSIALRIFAAECCLLLRKDFLTRKRYPI